MEIRTNKMMLVWSIISTKRAARQPWHFCSRRKLPKSQYTHLARRHVEDMCPHNQNSHVCREGPPLVRLLGRFHTGQQGCQAEQPRTTHRLLGKFHTGHQGCQDIYQEDPEGQTPPLSRHNWGRARPLLRQPSFTHQSAAPRHAGLPWHRVPEALPCWMEDFTSPAAHLALEILPCKMLTTPLPPPRAVSWTCGLRLWDLGLLSPTNCSVCVCVCVCVCCISLTLLVWVAY